MVSYLSGVFGGSQISKYTVPLEEWIKKSEPGYPLYGRENLVDKAIDSIKRRESVFIVGPSGTGKTTFVHQIFHKLKREHYPLEIRQVMPGHSFNETVAKSLFYEKNSIRPLFKEVVNNGKIILFIDELPELPASTCKIILDFKANSENLILIGVGTSEQVFEALMVNDGEETGMRRRSLVLRLGPMTIDETLSLIRNRARQDKTIRHLFKKTISPSSNQSSQLEPDQAKPGQAEPDQAKPGQAEPDQAKPGQAEPDQAKPGQAEPDQAKPGQAESDQAESSQAKPGQAGPDQVESSQAKPGQAGPDQVESSQAKPGQAGPDQVESSQAKPGQAGPDQVESSQAKPGQAGPDQAESSQVNLEESNEEKILNLFSKIVVGTARGQLHEQEVFPGAANKYYSMIKDCSFASPSALMASAAAFLKIKTRKILSWITAIDREMGIEENFSKMFFTKLPQTSTALKLDGFQLHLQQKKMTVLQRPGSTEWLKNVVTNVKGDWSFCYCDLKKIIREENSIRTMRFLLEKFLKEEIHQAARPILMVENSEPFIKALFPTDEAETSVEEVGVPPSPSSVMKKITNALEKTTEGAGTVCKLDTIFSTKVDNAMTRMDEGCSLKTASKKDNPKILPIVNDFFSFLKQEKIQTILLLHSQRKFTLSYTQWPEQYYFPPMHLTETIDWLESRTAERGVNLNRALIRQLFYAFHFIDSDIHLSDSIPNLVAAFTDSLSLRANTERITQANVGERIPVFLLEKLQLVIPFETVSNALGLAEVQMSNFLETPSLSPTNYPLSRPLPQKMWDFLSSPQPTLSVLWIVGKPCRAREKWVSKQIKNSFPESKFFFFHSKNFDSSVPESLKKELLKDGFSQVDEEDDVVIIDQPLLKDPLLVPFLKEKKYKILCFSPLVKPTSFLERLVDNTLSKIFGRVKKTITETLSLSMGADDSENSLIFEEKGTYTLAPLGKQEKKAILRNRLESLFEEKTITALENLYHHFSCYPGVSFDNVYQLLDKDLRELKRLDSVDIGEICNRFHSLYGERLKMSQEAVQYKANPALAPWWYRAGQIVTWATEALIKGFIFYPSRLLHRIVRTTYDWMALRFARSTP